MRISSSASSARCSSDRVNMCLETDRLIYVRSLPWPAEARQRPAPRHASFRRRPRRGFLDDRQADADTLVAHKGARIPRSDEPLQIRLGLAAERTGGVVTEVGPSLAWPRRTRRVLDPGAGRLVPARATRKVLCAALDATIADQRARPGDEAVDVVLMLSAEGARSVVWHAISHSAIPRQPWWGGCFLSVLRIRRAA